MNTSLESDRWENIALTLDFLGNLPQVSHLTVLLGELGSDGYAPASAPIQPQIPSPTNILCDALYPHPTTPIRCPVLRSVTIEWEGRFTPDTAAAVPRFRAMPTAHAHAGKLIRPSCRWARRTGRCPTPVYSVNAAL